MASTSKPTEQSIESERCAHCGIETVTRNTGTWALQSSAVEDNDSEAPKYFCCSGCMGAYALIHQLGLENFYSLRSLSQDEPQPIGKTQASDILKNLSDSGVAVQKLSDGTCRVRLSVEGLHCTACSWLIESLPPSIPGLKSANVRLSDRSLELLYDPSRTEPFRVAEFLAKFGYILRPDHDQELEDQSDRYLRRQHWFWIAVAFFIAANAMWIAISLYAGESTGMAPEHERFLRWIGAGLGLLATIFPGRTFMVSAWQSFKTKVPHVDIPISIGLLVGTIGSLIGAASNQGHIYFDSLASLVLLLRVGRYIQFRAQFRSGMSIAKLLRFHEIEAVRVAEDGEKRVVQAKRLKSGDRVEVRAGCMVPTDGVISYGDTELQTAFITGESQPQRVGIGDEVIGGSLNLKSAVELIVTRTSDEGRLGQISGLIQQATADRTPLIQLANKVGRIFVWVVLVLASLTCLFWWVIQGPTVALERTIALLTIACPCALALAAPLVITVAIGRAAKERIWIRDGDSLERLSNPGIVCMDKTGTLTFGDLRVMDWDGTWDLLPTIEAIESHSNHPVALAIVDYCRSRSDRGGATLEKNVHRVSEIREDLGKGIGAMVDGKQVFIGKSRNDANSSHPHHSDLNTPDLTRKVSVYIDEELQGTFSLGDRQRPGVQECLKRLQSRGWRLAILSGDDSPQVAQLAGTLRSAGIVIDECQSGLSPEQKQEYLQRFRRQGVTTVMVGDGINDAIALATADVGIAVRGPSEISLKNAPIYIGENHLESLPRLFDAAKNAVKAIHRCFAASLLYNCITLGLAATGYIHPLIAAIFMPISGITVLLMAWAARTFPTCKTTNL